MAVSAPPPQRRRSSAWVLVLLVVAVLFVGVPVLFCSLMAGKTVPIENGTVVVVRLDGPIAEGPPASPFAKISLAASGVLSLHDLRDLAAAVKTDDRVAGVLFQIGALDVQFGTVEDVRDVIADIKTKKPVQVLLTSDFIDEKSYYAAVGADRIVVNPEAGVALNGFDANVAFYAGTLEKLHAKAKFIGFKKYKSAVEPFTRKDMSAEYRETLESILGDYDARMLDAIAAARGVDKATVQTLFDKGGLTSKEAVDAKLVDAAGYYDEVEEAIRTKSAPDVKEPHPVTGARYLAGHRLPARGDKIAVLYASGMITSAAGSGGIFGGEGISGPDLAAAIRDAANDKSVKAILMRVNSPGGSAVGSDFIRREIVRAKAKKPVVISMGGLAASGGYWISMDSDEIVAQPSTLTGSIGVFFGKFNINGTYEWAGAHVDEVKVGGANADILSPYKDLTPQQEETMKAQIGGVYHDFVQHVADGRHMKFDGVDDIAGGRVWTGAQGKKNGLVDEVGGFAVALAETKKRAKITGDVQLQIFPREKTGLEAIAELLNTGATAADAAQNPPSLDSMVLQVKKELSTPAVWALAPEIEVR